MTKELAFSVSIHDCEVQTFRAGGKGGQNQNKRDSGVRVIHHESGARGEARDQRSQRQNKKAAFTRMCRSDEFKLWVRMQMGSDAKEIARVESLFWGYMGSVKIEYRENGQWVKAKRK